MGIDTNTHVSDSIYHATDANAVPVSKRGNNEDRKRKDGGDEEYQSIERSKRRKEQSSVQKTEAALDDTRGHVRTTSQQAEIENADQLKARQSPDAANGRAAEQKGPNDQQISPLAHDDWLRSRTSRTLDFEDDEGDVVARPVPQPNKSKDQDDEFSPVNAPLEEAAQQEEPDQKIDQPGKPPAEEDAIRKTKRIFLRNLPYSASEDDLRDLFSCFGKLTEVRALYTAAFSHFRDEYLDRDILCQRQMMPTPREYFSRCFSL